MVQQLSLADTKLLKWSEEDKATDPEAATLGAGLDRAVDLYEDLQEICYQLKKNDFTAAVQLCHQVPLIYNAMIAHKCLLHTHHNKC